MKYSKLVRDKIPEIIKQNGKEPRIHIATDEEYSKKLKAKLLEEVKEFLKDDTEEELADILEVIEAIQKLETFNQDSILTIKKSKVEKKGKFLKKIILDEVT